MADKQIVDTAGSFLLGSSSGSPSDIYAGTNNRTARLARSTETATAKAIGDSYSQTDVTGRSYELSGTIYLAPTDTDGIFSVGDTCYGTYKSQTGTTIFAGACVVTACSDSQSVGDYEMQDVTLRSTGAPDVG